MHPTSKTLTQNGIRTSLCKGSIQFIWAAFVSECEQHFHRMLCLVIGTLIQTVPEIQAQELPFTFERDVMIAMRDGTKLAANIFRPKAEGKYPVILMRSPYGKPDEKSGDAKRYTAAGYVMVVQDCRGKGKSDGLWDPFRYDKEDGYDTHDWISKQSWCDGQVGTSGGSYVGWTQWASAADSHPSLKAMVPVVPFADVFDDIAYPGGAFQLSLLMGWGTGVGGVALTPEKMQSAFRHLPLKNFGDQFEKKIPYLNDWVTHSSYDGYWKQRGIDRRFERVKVPTLNIGGWYDIFSKTTIELTDRVRDSARDPHARRNQLVIMGPWAHGVGVRKVGGLDFGESAALKLAELQFQWFEYWLKGRNNGVADWPAYYLFVMGKNEWRGEHEWPLARTRFTPYYLSSGGKANTSEGDGRLTLSMPGAEQPDRFSYDGDDPVPTAGGNNLVGAPIGPLDQSEVEKRKDVLVYTSDVITDPVEVTGPIKAVIYAASTAKDTDFTAKLVDVHPDGKAYLITDGILRARYRKGLDRVVLLEPGKVERYDIDLWVTSNVFKRGHRIRVEISSSNFPRFDRNANSGNQPGTDTELLGAVQMVLHDSNYASHILLPIIPN